MMANLIKRSLANLATAAPVRYAFTRLLLDQAVIFMFHRFQDPEYGIAGDSPMLLRRALTEIRRSGLSTVPLMELFDRARIGRSIRGLVAFTVDDGYGDFHRVGGPMFEAMECPVTVFLPTGFLDRPRWLWWDRLRYAMEMTGKRRTVVKTKERPVTVAWGTPSERRIARHKISDRLQDLEEKRRDEVMTALEDDLEVKIPKQLPVRFAPMTWDQVRENARKGVTFGPHSVSHPNLGLASAEVIQWEISRSWTRVKEETDGAIPIFCHPFGGQSVLGAHVRKELEKSGLLSAVTTVPGYLSSPSLRRAPFEVPRFSWPGSIGGIREITFGVQKAKDFLLPTPGKKYAPERR